MLTTIIGVIVGVVGGGIGGFLGCCMVIGALMDGERHED